MLGSHEAPPKRPRRDQPVLPDDVIVDQILTRVPAAAAVRFRAVCRAWRAALTSDHFVAAHRDARAAGQPEIVFFAPRPAAAGGTAATGFYTRRLNLTAVQQDDNDAAARELLAVQGLRSSDVVLSGTAPCRGLTLLSQPGSSQYHVCNLSTGEHVALPACPWARIVDPHESYVLSSAGIGFDAAAGEHKVARLYEDWSLQQRCEAYGLRSGGWRPCGGGGHVPPHACKGLTGRPPVFLDGDGCFYWHINTSLNFHGADVARFRTPEPILSLSVATGRFGWVRPPTPHYFHLAELDGSLCVAVDFRLTHGSYDLWTRPPGSGGSWSLRCRLSLPSLPLPVRGYLGRGHRILPLASSFDGKILLATTCHEVFAYDPRSNTAERVFWMQEFVDAPACPELLLNVALHEDTVTGVCHPHTDRGTSQLNSRLCSTTVARRQVPAHHHRDDFFITPQFIQAMINLAAQQYNLIVNMNND